MSAKKAKLSEEQKHNYCLIRNIPYKLIVQTKLDEKPENLETSKTYSLCVADLLVAEGRESLVLLDKSSSREFIPNNLHRMAIRKMEKSSKGESIKEIQSRTEGCEQWVPYIGLEERPPIRTEKGVFGPGTKLYEDFKEEDSIDQRPYLLITTIESFVKNNFLEGDFTPKEVKLFVPFELADRAFGYGTKVELRGVTEEEIEKYEFARKYSEDGQAVCRQTFARITGTYGERTQSHTNFTKICKGAKIRTSITKGMKDTSSHFDPNKVYHISFSGQRFQELFGSLDRLVETCGSGGGGVSNNSEQYPHESNQSHSKQGKNLGSRQLERFFSKYF